MTACYISNRHLFSPIDNPWEGTASLGSYECLSLLSLLKEQMSHLPVSLIPIPRVTEEKTLPDCGQRGWIDFDQVVDVIAHQNIGLQATVTPPSGFLKQLQISPPVGVIRKDPLTLITPADHMIQSAWTIHSRFSCHARSYDGNHHKSIRHA